MTTPWRSASAFSGGLVPGVDVMAYMMHLPVAKWGRTFLERGLIEARFVKPVYDGETADVTGEESNGVLVDPGREPRRSFARPARRRCRHLRQSFSIGRLCARSRLSASASRLTRRRTELGKWLGTRAARLGGRRGTRSIWPIFAKPIRSTRAKVSAIPACCSG